MALLSYLVDIDSRIPATEFEQMQFPILAHDGAEFSVGRDLEIQERIFFGKRQLPDGFKRPIRLPGANCSVIATTIQDVHGARVGDRVHTSRVSAFPAFADQRCSQSR